MQRVLITTLGCKVNQYESAAFRTAFDLAGCKIVKSGDSADIVVINTCAVTTKAGAQSRQAVRKAIRSNPEARIVITGCYAEIAATQLGAMDDLVGRQYTIIGNSKKDELVGMAISENMQQLLLGSISMAKEICQLPVRSFGDRTRAYLRVQDGCESFCTYCIVPYTRGPSRSLSITEAVNQARTFAAEGYKEIVLTGIHLGYYGRDLANQSSITDLIDILSLETPEVRYRISSLEPTEITEKLLNLMQNRKNITPHLHIPLQSGDDKILAKMNRRYTTAEFENVVTTCLKALPDAAIGIDILAGFPGETEEHFIQTRNFISSLDCTYLHVFPYSRRPGTAAADFPDNVSKEIKDQRVAELRELGTKKRELFYLKHIGTTLPVLVEGKRDSKGHLQGFTDNYISVHFAGNDNLKNSVVNVMLNKLDGTHVLGEVVKDNAS